MNLRKFLDKHKISYKSAAENMGLHYSNIYPLLDSKVFNNESLMSAIDYQVTSMTGEYKMVRTSVGDDGTVTIKISHLPIDKMDKQNKSAFEWVNELAGDISAGEIAVKSGYSLATIHSVASRSNISLRVK